MGSQTGCAASLKAAIAIDQEDAERGRQRSVWRESRKPFLIPGADEDNRRGYARELPVGQETDLLACVAFLSGKLPSGITRRLRGGLF